MVMVFNATFNNISVISWWSACWWRKPEYPEKTIDLPQSNNQLVNVVIYTLQQKFKSHPVFFSLFLRMKEVELGLLFC
jgi:hypothetical protein